MDLKLVGVIGVGGFLMYLAVLMANYQTEPPKPIQGPVLGKEYVPASTRTYFIIVGRMQVPHTEEVPERWRLKIGDEWIFVPKDDFDRTKIGDVYIQRRMEGP